MPQPLNIALLEPYYGGSHKVFCDTLAAHSRHRIRLVTMPARKWKWRMRGAAIWFTREQTEWLSGEPIDAIVCSDMLAVADLRAMLPAHLRSAPIACYFHENQLTYPLQPGEPRDLQYGMTNITSCLAADAVYFNSAFHKSDFLRAADELLRQMPDHVPARTIGEIAAKSTVLPPPIDLGSEAPPFADTLGQGSSDVPIIVWCHRWEYDKNPEPFFSALRALDEARVPFRLVLLGEQFTNAPAIFADAWPRLQRHVAHAGYIEDRVAYLRMLRQCDVVVSTAIQEFCGLSVIEAMLCGCQPLLPDRLAYPELIPPDLRPICLYENDDALENALVACLRGTRRLNARERRLLQESLQDQFGAKAATQRIDDALSTLVHGAK